MSEEDVPLSVPAVPDSLARDTTQPLEVASFDLPGFLRGVRPTRRTVKLHERADLIGVLDELVNRIDALPDGDEADALIDQFETVRAEFQAGVTYWTVERRSSEWVEAQWEDCARRHGFKLVDGDTKNRKHRLVLLMDQLAAQIVEVKDESRAVSSEPVTVERLRALFDVNEGELNKLMFAMQDANTSMAQQAGVLTRDFSQRSSTGRNGSAS